MEFVDSAAEMVKIKSRLGAYVRVPATFSSMALQIKWVFHCTHAELYRDRT